MFNPADLNPEAQIATLPEETRERLNQTPRIYLVSIETLEDVLAAAFELGASTAALGKLDTFIDEYTRAMHATDGSPRSRQPQQPRIGFGK